jgi:hypothetical protein
MHSKGSRRAQSLSPAVGRLPLVEVEGPQNMNIDRATQEVLGLVHLPLNVLLQSRAQLWWHDVEGQSSEAVAQLGRRLLSGG